MSCVFVDVSGHQVDVHPVQFDKARGGGVYVMEDGDEWVYPTTRSRVKARLAAKRCDA